MKYLGNIQDNKDLVTKEYVDEQISTVDGKMNKVANAEVISNKVTSITSSSTDTQYPSAKAVYDEVSQLNEDIADIKNLTFRHGTVTLTNSDEFPFNNSQQTISLGTAMPDTNYIVSTQILSSVGNPGEIEVKDKLVNGFKLNYTGSASAVVVDYIVIGGMGL